MNAYNALSAEFRKTELGYKRFDQESDELKQKLNLHFKGIRGLVDLPNRETFGPIVADGLSLINKATAFYDKVKMFKGIYMDFMHFEMQYMADIKELNTKLNVNNVEAIAKKGELIVKDYKGRMQLQKQNLDALVKTLEKEKAELQQMYSQTLQ